MGTTIRCKMKVTEVVTSVENGKKAREEIKLEAVSGPEGTENGTWSKYTPSGYFSLAITNESAFGQLEQGKEYYIDMTPAS